MTGARGRLPRLVAIAVLLAAAAALILAVAARRELEARWWLWRVQRVPREAVRPPLERLVALLGLRDPRVRALLFPAPGELEVRFSPGDGIVALGPGAKTLDAEVSMRNLSGRRLILVPEPGDPFLAAGFFAAPDALKEEDFESFRCGTGVPYEEPLVNAVALDPGEQLVKRREITVGKVRRHGAVEARLKVELLRGERSEAKSVFSRFEYAEAASHSFRLEAP